MQSGTPIKEGFIPFRGYKTWYRVVGDHEEPGRLPILCLHGGPGPTHAFLQPFESIASSGRRVIFYDQLGSGNSNCPPDPTLWAMDLFVQELGTVCEALELDHVHLLGFSWGGIAGLAICPHAAKVPGQPGYRKRPCKHPTMDHRDCPFD